MVRSKAPFLLSIVAEEIGSLSSEGNTSTKIDLAILIEDETNDPPEFNQDRYTFPYKNTKIKILKNYNTHNRYVAHLMENSPVGTALYFGDGQNPQVTDNDQVI